MNCRFCDKYFLYIGSHERSCPLNPNREIFLKKLKEQSNNAAEIKKSNWNEIFASIKEVISSKGGECLSNSYSGYNDKIKIKCKLGHIWETNSYSILRRGSWCKKCSDKKLTLSILDFQKLALERGGKCLSLSYNYNDEKLLWECYFGHQWLAKPSHIKNAHQSWCPTCSSGLYERICRLYMESIFNKPFIKIRPKWLLGANNSPLELDGYCEELGIAFEHNGFQHYIDNQDVFNIKDLRENDRIKYALCEQNGVKLIIIPELFNRTKLSELKDLIKSKCLDLKIKLPDDYDNIIIDHNLAYKNNKDEDVLLRLKNNLKSKNMEMISDYYLGINALINIKCLICNRIYNKKTNYVLNNPYCKYCDNAGILIAEIENVIINNGGILLSDISMYEKVPLKLTIHCKCECGKDFKKKIKNLMNGSWCQSCARIKNPPRKRKSLIERKQFASLFNGECLDIEDIKDGSKSSWKCENGHIFQASFHTVRRRQNYCLICNPQLKIKDKITGKFIFK